MKYVGQCRHAFAPHSDEGKAEFAQSCFSSWPCAGRHPLNFSGCPENWTQDGDELRCTQELPWYVCFSDGFQFVQF